MTPLLHSLYWLPFNQRVFFKILSTTFKAIHREGVRGQIFFGYSTETVKRTFQTHQGLYFHQYF